MSGRVTEKYSILLNNLNISTLHRAVNRRERREGLYQCGETIRPFKIQHVTRVRQDLEPRAGHRRRESDRYGTITGHVPATGEDQGRRRHLAQATGKVGRVGGGIGMGPVPTMIVANDRVHGRVRLREIGEPARKALEKRAPPDLLDLSR